MVLFFRKEHSFASFVASGAGSGYSPWAPGTAGSLVGLAIGVGLLTISPWLLLAGAAIATAAGFAAIPPAEADADPGWIVIDEIAGQMVALLALHRPGWIGVALAFALFRLFDIAKPGPVGWADRQGGAAGIMADDLIAGALAALVLLALPIPLARG